MKKNREEEKVVEGGCQMEKIKHKPRVSKSRSDKNTRPKGDMCRGNTRAHEIGG